MSSQRKNKLVIITYIVLYFAERTSIAECDYKPVNEIVVVKCIDCCSVDPNSNFGKGTLQCRNISLIC